MSVCCNGICDSPKPPPPPFSSSFIPSWPFILLQSMLLDVSTTPSSALYCSRIDLMRRIHQQSPSRQHVCEVMTMTAVDDRSINHEQRERDQQNGAIRVKKKRYWKNWMRGGEITQHDCQQDLRHTPRSTVLLSTRCACPRE